MFETESVLDVHLFGPCFGWSHPTLALKKDENVIKVLGM